MRLERDDHRVFRERCIGVDLLVRRVRLNIEIDAVAKAQTRSPVHRLVAFRIEAEAEFEMGFGGAAARVNVARSERKRGPAASRRRLPAGRCPRCGRLRELASSWVSCVLFGAVLGERHVVEDERPPTVFAGLVLGTSFTSRISSDFT